ncbi:MAG: FixH family protein [Geminicoccaceae bacterium]
MSGGRFTGTHMAIVMVLFFGVTIGVNLVLAVLATGSFPGLVVENSYVASQEYNRVLADAEAQRQRGWHSEITVDRDLTSIDLVKANGLAAAGLDVRVELGRPAHEGDDRTLDLTETERGHYEASVDLAAGRWDALFVARTVDGVVVHQERLRVAVP